MSKEEYIQENKELFKSFLDITFLKSWYNYVRGSDLIIENYHSLELDFDYHCNLGCTYCYYSKYGRDLFRGSSPSKEKVLTNLEKVMKFLGKNKFTPNLEIFSGEFFNLPYWREALDIIYENLREMDIKNRPISMSIPTNLVSVAENNIEQEVYQYLRKFREIKVRVNLSGSVDGPYFDNLNRPRKDGGKYDASFYRAMANFNKKTLTGNHPMVYSKHNEYLVDNLLWFLEADNLNSTYLLEVRNPEWTGQELKTMYYSIKSYILYLFSRVNFDLESFKRNLNDNMLSSFFSTTGRGIGCSIQSDIQLQLNDLSIIPCHRLSYQGQIPAKFEIDDEGNWDIEVDNVELYLAIQSTDVSYISQCRNCPINIFCSGTCLGSNYESTGEIFTPAPSVCLLEFTKVNAIIHAMDEIGYIDFVKSTQNQNEKAKSQIEHIRRTNIEEILEQN